MADQNVEIAVLGGGCFWCVEAVFAEIAGITAVTSGYSGGRTVNPTYYEVCSEKTGHAEVVQLEFDPCQITYSEILEVFFWRWGSTGSGGPPEWNGISPSNGMGPNTTR